MAPFFEIHPTFPAFLLLMLWLVIPNYSILKYSSTHCFSVDTREYLGTRIDKFSPDFVKNLVSSSKKYF